MKKLIIALLLLPSALAGCATAAREDKVMLREKAPLLTLESSRSVDDYIGCLNPKLVAIRPPVSLMRDGNATVLRMTSFAQPVLVVEVTPRATGSIDIVLRARFDNALGVSASVKAAQECR